ncbi:hypothetical protein ASPFODRAFT_276022 [Aspergillus luchuensis CBS 106.47]|uniref:Uncharacterized protein n=1 Tax=Aspergillus luchuensis (strain CBS 106.47) TaxID=1137211 RepID=A0A1M3U172_ASPLC|nr:hypothetical protein ASPFODRAFT_276022 [Aspergillus luchuensis CBS 106.47]
MNVRFPLCSSILFIIIIISFWKIDFSLTISRSLKGRERSLSIDLCINIARWTARCTPFCRVFRRCDIIVPPNVSARFPFFPLPLFHLGLSLVLFPLFCTQQRRAISISILVCLVFFLHVYT